MATMMIDDRTRPRSVARGEMTTQGLCIFKHDPESGNAHAHSLLDRLSVERRVGVEVPRDFGAYSVTFDGDEVKVGHTVQAAPRVTMIRRC